MKSLYIVDYWVPFPSSEYGGLINVIARSDQECHDILIGWRDDLDSDFDSKIMERVVKAPCYKLADDIESGVVEAFTT